MTIKALMIFSIKLIVFILYVQGSPSNPDSEWIQEVTDPPTELTSTEKSRNFKVRPIARAGEIKFEQNVESDLRDERFQRYPNFYRLPIWGNDQNQKSIDSALNTDQSVLIPTQEVKIQTKDTNFESKGADGNETADNEKEVVSAISDSPSKPEDVLDSRNLNVPPPSSVENAPLSDLNFLVEIINDFAFKFEQTFTPNTNFFISPLSIFISMAMTYLGSGGNTKKQMEDGLGLSTHAMHDSHFHENMAHLFASLALQNGNAVLAIANGMFLSDKLSVKPEFKKTLQDLYAAKLQNMNFEDGDSTMKILNQWVEKSTGNMIKDFLKRAPNPATRLLLLNAVYFKGAWKTKFPKERTFTGEFFSLDGTTKRMRMMILYKEKFLYRSEETMGYSFVKLPYDGESISMIIALPSNTSQAPDLKMNHKTLCELQDKMISRKMGNLVIPRFNFEYSIGLKPSLKVLGISDLFDANANLTGISDGNNLYVSNVLHKAIIEVTEEGTTAAAVTQVGIRMLSVGVEPDFIVNHPFAFYIVDEKSRVILFQGKAYGPAGSSSGGKQRIRQRVQVNSRGKNTTTSYNRNVFVNGNRSVVITRGIKV